MIAGSAGLGAAVVGGVSGTMTPSDSLTGVDAASGTAGAGATTTVSGAGV
jgi:hypothetical protein